jgi:hypothetical protein
MNQASLLLGLEQLELDESSDLPNKLCMVYNFVMVSSSTSNCKHILANCIDK